MCIPSPYLDPFRFLDKDTQHPVNRPETVHAEWNVVLWALLLNPHLGGCAAKKQIPISHLRDRRGWLILSHASFIRTL